MQTKKLLFYLLAAAMGGCVPVMSLHPLYTHEDAVFEKKLLGTWIQDPNDPESIWEFKAAGEPENSYELTFTDKDGQKGLFTAHLLKLEDNTFLDVYPKHFPSGSLDDPNAAPWPYNQFFFAPAHTFLKVDAIEPQLIIRLSEDDQMEKLLEEDPNAIAYEQLEDGFILTAPTKQLQTFVIKYANDKRLFLYPTALTRQTADPPKPSPPKDPNEAAKKE